MSRLSYRRCRMASICLFLGSNPKSSFTRCRICDHNTPNCVIAVAIAFEIQGALPAKSRLGQLLEIGSRNYGFDALQSFGYLNRSAEWVSEVWQGGSLSL